MVGCAHTPIVEVWEWVGCVLQWGMGVGRSQYIMPTPIEGEVVLPYGRGRRSVVCGGVDWIAPRPMGACASVGAAFADEMGALPPAVVAKVAGAGRVGVVINDQTRPPVHRVLVPLVVRWVRRVSRGTPSITVYVANGLHPRLSDERLAELIPASWGGEVAVVQHDAARSALSECGVTTRATPVVVNSRLLVEDVRVVIGVVEPHQFMGYTGGAKGVAIGMGGLKTITANHALLKSEGAALGVLEGNPARADVEEIGERIGVDICIDSLMNDEGEIAALFCGSSRVVMRRAVAHLAPYRICRITERYDAVVASVGGWPKDINLYQSQKALAHAARAAAPHAPIILVAQCHQGVGDRSFEEWYGGCASAEEALARFEREEFAVGPHKGYLWARDSCGRTLWLYSDLPAAQVRRLHCNPVRSLHQTVEGVCRRAMRVAVLPHATMIGVEVGLDVVSGGGGAPAAPYGGAQGQ